MYEFEHVTTSPEYPQSNGRVENAVKTSKDLMKKAGSTNSDFQLALLDWRNTPTEGMKSSPGQRIFCRRTRTLLPTTRELLEPHLVRDVRVRKLRRKEVQTRYFNRNGKKTFQVLPRVMLYAWNCKPQMEGTDGPRPRLNNKETLDPMLLERIAVISPTSRSPTSLVASPTRWVASTTSWFFALAKRPKTLANVMLAKSLVGEITRYRISSCQYGLKYL